MMTQLPHSSSFRVSAAAAWSVLQIQEDRKMHSERQGLMMSGLVKLALLSEDDCCCRFTSSFLLSACLLCILCSLSLSPYFLTPGFSWWCRASKIRLEKEKKSSLSQPKYRKTDPLLLFLTITWWWSQMNMSNIEIRKKYSQELKRRKGFLNKSIMDDEDVSCEWCSWWWSALKKLLTIPSLILQPTETHSVSNRRRKRNEGEIPSPVFKLKVKLIPGVVKWWLTITRQRRELNNIRWWWWSSSWLTLSSFSIWIFWWWWTHSKKQHNSKNKNWSQSEASTKIMREFYPLYIMISGMSEQHKPEKRRRKWEERSRGKDEKSCFFAVGVERRSHRRSA